MSSANNNINANNGGSGGRRDKGKRRATSVELRAERRAQLQAQLEALQVELAQLADVDAEEHDEHNKEDDDEGEKGEEGEKPAEEETGNSARIGEKRKAPEGDDGPVPKRNRKEGPWDAERK